MEKDNYFQEIKGLCIIAVIIIHLPIGNEVNGTFDYWLSLRSIINFPVAIFFFLSGYFDKRVAHNNLTNNKTEIELVTHRLKRIGIPYLLWSSIYMTITYLLGQKLSNNKIIFSFLTGNAYGHLYYLLVLIQLTILSPIIIKIIKSENKTLHYFSLLTSFIWVLVIYIYCLYFNKQLPLYETIFPAWYSFYYWGLYRRYISTNAKPINETNSIKIYGLLLISLIFSVFESNMIFNYTELSSVASSQIKLSAFMYVFIMIELILTHKNHHFNRSNLSRIGDYSFGIYLIHHIFLIPTNIIISRLNMPDYLFIIEQGISLTIVLCLSYYSISIANKFLSSKIVNSLGLI